MICKWLIYINKKKNPSENEQNKKFINSSKQMKRSITQVIYTNYNRYMPFFIYQIEQRFFLKC